MIYNSSRSSDTKTSFLNVLCQIALEHFFKTFQEIEKTTVFNELNWVD